LWGVGYGGGQTRQLFRRGVGAVKTDRRTRTDR